MYLQKWLHTSHPTYCTQCHFSPEPSPLQRCAILQCPGLPLPHCQSTDDLTHRAPCHPLPMPSSSSARAPPASTALLCWCSAVTRSICLLAVFLSPSPHQCSSAQICNTELLLQLCQHSQSFTGGPFITVPFEPFRLPCWSPERLGGVLQVSISS